jgi:hypothetical protein
MIGDIYATVKELTQPRSSGNAVNKHAVTANRKVEPDYERMRQLTVPGANDRAPA